MKIQDIINLLKKSGCNSKKQVIQLLETADTKELSELARDCNTRIAELRCKKGNENGNR